MIPPVPQFTLNYNGQTYQPSYIRNFGVVPHDLKLNPPTPGFNITVKDTEASFSFTYGVQQDYKQMFNFDNGVEETTLISIDAPFGFGEVFHPDFPFPICTLQNRNGPNRMRLVPHNMAPDGFDLHSFGRWIKLVGLLFTNDLYDISCTVKLNADPKTLAAYTPDTQNIQKHWMLTQFLFDSKFSFPMAPTYPVPESTTSPWNWTPPDIPRQTTAIIIGPGINSEAEFQLFLDGFVNLWNRDLPNKITKANIRHSMPYAYTGSGRAQESWFAQAASRVSSNYNAALHGFASNIFSNPDPALNPTTASMSTFVFSISETFELGDEDAFFVALYVDAISPNYFTVIASTLPFLSTHIIPQPEGQIISLASHSLDTFPKMARNGDSCTSSLHCMRNWFDWTSVRSSTPLPLDFSSPPDLFKVVTPSAIKTPADIPEHLDFCYQNVCRNVKEIPRDAMEEFILFQQDPAKMRRSTIDVDVEQRIGENDFSFALGNVHEYTHGYEFPPLSVLQFTANPKLNIAINFAQIGLQIDNNNQEYPSLVGETCLIKVVSYPTTTEGEIIDEKIFRVRWMKTETITSINTPLMVYLPPDLIPSLGSNSVILQVEFPNLRVSPRGVSVIETTPFYAMSACMTPPTNPADFHFPAKWTDACAQHGYECLSEGVCSNLSPTTPLPSTSNPTLKPFTKCSSVEGYCGANGTCDKFSSLCTCNSGWQGDQCEVASQCTSKGRSSCSNHGHFVAAPDSNECSADGGCQCDGFWQGATCGSCGVRCLNGGRASSSCTGTCGCAVGFSGDLCQCIQRQATLTINLNSKLVNYVNAQRDLFGEQNQMTPTATKSMDLYKLAVPTDTVEEYYFVQDTVATEVGSLLGLDKQKGSAIAVTLESIAATATRMTFKMTYNCDRENSINMDDAWAGLMGKTTFPGTQVTALFNRVGNSLSLSNTAITQTSSLTADHTISGCDPATDKDCPEVVCDPATDKDCPCDPATDASCPCTGPSCPPPACNSATETCGTKPDENGNDGANTASQRSLVVATFALISTLFYIF